MMERKWWKEQVVYQVYPISFMDANGDGIGDLQGIIQKLDYLKDLGVGIIWLSPVYASPNKDNGYDISDYEAIMPQFGTMEDWEQLLKEIHQRGLKLVMDLVVNHSSDQHRWFQEAKKSKDSPYRDYYIWRDPKPDGGRPNNWTSYFSGPAWDYDETTGQYYLHIFTKEQPDLNWENPKLRQEIYKMMGFWLNKGIDGFRIDVLHGWAKTPDLPDGKPIETGIVGMEHFCNLPHIHDYVREMHREVFSKYDCVSVGETGGVTIEDAKIYTNPENLEVSMVFQFEHVDIGDNGKAKWFTQPRIDIKEFKGYLSKWQKGLDGVGWNSLYLSNHDQPRQISRFGDDKIYHEKSAKMLATMIHLQQGTPYVYQGEELGMTNVHLENIQEARDVQALNAWEEYVESGMVDGDTLMQGINHRGRDNARTPMQWDDSENAGFTKGAPWIKLNPNYKTLNTVAEMSDENSVLHYYKKLISLRKKSDVVVYGDFKEYYEDSDKLYCFTRNLQGESLFVALNMTAEAVACPLPRELSFASSSLYISNYEVKETLADLMLRPYEAVAYLLK